jgi:hypothetical protein
MRTHFYQSAIARPLALLAIAGAMLVATSCTSGPTVRAEFDKSADFTRYKTFGFMSPLGTDRSGYSSMVSQYLKTATRKEFEARGLTYAETSPQLIVNFNAKLSDKLRTETVPGSAPMGGYYGYRGGYYSTWPMYGGTETVVSQYTEGTLNIDVVDASHKQMVWEGVAVGSVSEKAASNLQAAVDKTVAKILAKYPVSPASAK